MKVSKQQKEDRQWKKRFEELKDYNRTYEDCNVPQGYIANPQLGTWVTTQRRNYKNGKLSKERKGLLENIGFTWARSDRNRISWEDQFEKLKSYKLEHGDCNVPQRYSDNPQLGTWVNNQRIWYKCNGKLDEERVDRLEALGFKWNLKQEQSGMTLVPISDAESDTDNCVNDEEGGVTNEGGEVAAISDAGEEESDGGGTGEFEGTPRSDPHHEKVGETTAGQDSDPGIDAEGGDEAEDQGGTPKNGSALENEVKGGEISGRGSNVQCLEHASSFKVKGSRKDRSGNDEAVNSHQCHTTATKERANRAARRRDLREGQRTISVSQMPPNTTFSIGEEPFNAAYKEETDEESSDGKGTSDDEHANSLALAESDKNLDEIGDSSADNDGGVNKSQSRNPPDGYKVCHVSIEEEDTDDIILAVHPSDKRYTVIGHIASSSDSLSAAFCGPRVGDIIIPPPHLATPEIHNATKEWFYKHLEKRPSAFFVWRKFNCDNDINDALSCAFPKGEWISMKYVAYRIVIRNTERAPLGIASEEVSFGRTTITMVKNVRKNSLGEKLGLKNRDIICRYTKTGVQLADVHDWFTHKIGSRNRSATFKVIRLHDRNQLKKMLSESSLPYTEH